MFWYETQFRHAEAARQRNKREERKLKIEIERKNGMQAIYKSEVDAVSKEQRRIKRELDRIRKSSVGPINVFNKNTKPYPIHSKMPVRASRSVKRKISRIEQRFQFLSGECDHGKNELENDLMRAIMFIDCKKNRSENNAVFSQDTKSHFNDLTTTDDSSSTSQRLVLGNDITTGDNSITQSEVDNTLHDTQSISNDTNVLKVLSSERSVSPAHSCMSTEELSNIEHLDNDQLTQLKTDYHSYREPESGRTTEYVTKHRIKSLDLSQLASLDMKSVKSNVSQRLLGANPPSQADLSRRRVSDGSYSISKTSSRVKQPTTVPKRRISDGNVLPKSTTSAVIGSSVSVDGETKHHTPEEHPKDKDRQTPLKKKVPKQPKLLSPKLDVEDEGEDERDGSSPRILGSTDEAWEMARKARYLRTNDPRQLEQERELSLKEIFD
ncbi:uncharacterized protein LOC126821582 [Patella vulgata]|uniref:uncharacterized protein LOC126821582 n=1 Tax=Patella vulgata TaxID=6465 RepID=UPI0021806274|nr:uncharacterized protein LOC126821582 [Patella vulgata]